MNTKFNTWKKVETPEEQAIAFSIRNKVFVEEQKVAEEVERDAFEQGADHVLVYAGEKPVGTGRIRVVDNTAKLERICVLADHRKEGWGKVIVHALETLAHRKGITKTKLHGQTHVKHFYETLGYQPVSEVFLDQSIPHQVMVKTLR